MQLTDPRGNLVANWTIEQFLLVQKFAMQGPGHPVDGRIVAMEIGQQIEVQLNDVESQLHDAHHNLLFLFNHVQHFDEHAQLHQAGLLISLLRDRLMRSQLPGFTKLICKIEENEYDPEI
uniref:Uncharacterized protein n=1 Tax=Pseudomonas phage HRDY3 TaxID=3236930 RepID=A0AB39CEL5_9VIRU